MNTFNLISGYMGFSLTAFERILKKAGAHRVSHEALTEFSKIMEEHLLNLAEESAILAKHAGRKTVIDDDVRAAKRKF